MTLNKTRVKIFSQKLFIKNYKSILLQETEILQVYAEKKML